MRLRTKCEQVQENFWCNENVLQLDYGDGYKTIDLPNPVTSMGFSEARIVKNLTAMWETPV